MHYPYHDINESEEINKDGDPSIESNPFKTKDEDILKKIKTLNEYVYYTIGQSIDNEDDFLKVLDRINKAFEVLHNHILKAEKGKESGHPLYP